MSFWFVVGLPFLLLPFWVRIDPNQIRPRTVVVIICLFVTVVLVGCFSADNNAPEDLKQTEAGKQSTSENRVTTTPVNTERAPVVERSDSYVGSNRCLTCHKDEHASWDESFHQSMTQTPTEDSVLGDFDDVHLELDGIDYHLERDEAGYWVSTNLGNGPTRMQIKLLTGSHHMQLYWFSLPDNIPPEGPKRILGLLPFSYLVSQNSWVPRRSTFLHPPVQNETFEVGRWNATCLRCHTTHPKADYFGKNNPLTTVAEFGISCEACHGPGKEHAEFFESNRNPDGGPHQIVNPLELDHVRASHVCANCHGATSVKHQDDAKKWHTEGNSFRPGNDLLEFRHLIRATRPDEAMTVELLQHDPQLFESVFWSDGMVRVTGREYSGLVETACHTKGTLSCLTCHTMHNQDAEQRPVDEPWNDDQLRIGMRSNKACLNCHEQYTGEALASHTRHLSESEGSKCYNCHMPHTSYGLLKAVRSHQISNPTVEETLKAGRQNACNNCHVDKPLQWTADHLHQWYGHDQQSLPDAHQKISSVVLHLLTGDAGQRALAAWALSWDAAQQTAGNTWQAGILSYGLDDPYDAARWMVLNSLKKLDPSIKKELTAQLSPDQIRSIQNRMLEYIEKEKAEQRVVRKPDGTLDVELLRFLLQQRNGRQMYLQE